MNPLPLFDKITELQALKEDANVVYVSQDVYESINLNMPFNMPATRYRGMYLIVNEDAKPGSVLVTHEEIVKVRLLSKNNPKCEHSYYFGFYGNLADWDYAEVLLSTDGIHFLVPTITTKRKFRVRHKEGKKSTTTSVVVTSVKEDISGEYLLQRVDDGHYVLVLLAPLNPVRFPSVVRSAHAKRFNA